ncbi:hypothetical protein [Clostridium botulinum]|uniref:Restriction endonuclease n=1 Tax=Clostridium botulinum TaxID=1491 RepID=A0A6B4G5M5_CLOBO|nr:hypothetical protein [Clostridium botulinum]MBN3383431.1 hypothetical protein [Clostridium botulinum]MBN3391570.1 hypothetical protein [Clostridium botulinum]MBN3431866.1 hypothetical protein [Clostridium botulinum]MBN3446730.1 hypothetical protein [Clostridium botulinum]NFF92196.1 hypothetical protein [Clostridium botulinum]
MTSYRLYPPFLYSPEEDDFSKVWESFCLKLLKAEMGTQEIERRNPPESGVDLYGKENKIAYQCKSVTKDGKFNVTKVKKSLDSALKIKETLPWKEYVICSNVNLTGKQINEIKSYNKEISIDTKGHDYWVGLCEKFPKIVERNFRKIVEIPYGLISSDFNIITNPKYNEFQEKLKINPIKILFYSEKHDKFYKLQASSQMTVNNLLFILRSFLRLDEVFKETGGKVAVKDSVIFNNIEYSYNEGEKLLDDLKIKDNSTIFYCLKYKIANHSESVLQCNPDELEYNVEEIERNIFMNFDKRVGKLLNGNDGVN